MIMPDYYKRDGIETIDVLRTILSEDEYRGFLIGNIFKYLVRYRKKDMVNDLQKAETYLAWLINSTKVHPEVTE